LVSELETPGEEVGRRKRRRRMDAGN